MRADIVYQVKLAYYDLAHFDEALRITEEERQLLRHYEETGTGPLFAGLRAATGGHQASNRDLTSF